MPSAIDRIRSKNKTAAAISQPQHPSSAFIRNLPTPLPAPISTSIEPITPPRADDRSSLPPPIPCPLCDCPAVWSTIYEPDVWKCCDCDPPPGGPGCNPWHWQQGGWSFVRRRLLLVIDDCHWHWEAFSRLDLKRFDVEVIVVPQEITTALADAAAA